jgi:hypothetical protein
VSWRSFYYSAEGRVRWLPELIPVDRGHYILTSLKAENRRTALGRLRTAPLDLDLFTRSAPGDRLLQKPRHADRQHWPSERLPWLRYHRWAPSEDVYGSRPRLGRLQRRHP